MKKVLAVLVLVVLVVMGGGLGFLTAMQPDQRDPSPEKVEATPARLARGEYLVEHVSDCTGCHSDRDLGKLGGPILPSGRGAGGMVFDEGVGFPGRVAAQNITSDPRTGLGSWTDGEIMRAIREGVSRDGHALFPMMPYKGFRSMSDEDVRSVVAYLRTLPPIDRETPPGKIDFPVSIFIKLVPEPLAGPVPEPDRSDGVAYGKYLTTLAGCLDCHTPADDKMRPIPGMEGAGGRRFDYKELHAVSPNITPDPTGIANVTRAGFISVFKSFDGLEPAPVLPAQQVVMPWLSFAGMTEADLGAIYDYLRTLKPVANEVKRGAGAGPAAAPASSAPAPLGAR